MINTEWKIQKSQYVCREGGHAMKPGTVCVTCLVEESTDQGETLVRHDFCEEHWRDGNVVKAFSFWKTVVPPPDKKKTVIDTALLENLFYRLLDETDPKKRAFCYLISLMLMRKKILKFEDSYKQDGQSYLVLKHAQEKRNYTLLDPVLSAEEIESIRLELEALLQSDLE